MLGRRSKVIIGKDGKVKHVHVIRALPGDKRNLKDALAQWAFKPHEVKGRSALGLSWQCGPAAMPTFADGVAR